jgi:hypothetical protein
MTRSLGLLALSQLATLVSPEAQADSMLPRFRLKDLGLASKYSSSSKSNPKLRWLSDGTVYGIGVFMDFRGLFNGGCHFHTPQERRFQGPTAR